MIKFSLSVKLVSANLIQVLSNLTDLEQRVEILEVEVENTKDEIEDVETDLIQQDNRITLMEETVITNSNDIPGLNELYTV